jgi:hypothetical protein
MTLKIAPDHVMVPRRNRNKSSWVVEEESEINSSHQSYAPLGASLNAKVRHLSKSEQRILVGPVIKEENKTEDVLSIESKRNGQSRRGLVFKIEAEVTVIGDLPEDGIAVETTTLLKPLKRDK